MKYLLIISSFYFLMAQCSDQKPEVKSCDTEVRVVKLDLDGCNLILQLDNGQRLEPVEVVPDFQLEAGQRLKIAYTEVDMMSICMVGQTVRVDCIEEIPENISCNQDGEMIPLEPNEPKPATTGFFEVRELSFERGEVKVEIAYSGCAPERDFKLYLDPMMTKSLPPQQSVYLSFEEQLCEAFFVQTICFPVKGIGQPTELKILDSRGNLHKVRVTP